MFLLGVKLSFILGSLSLLTSKAFGKAPQAVIRILVSKCIVYFRGFVARFQNYPNDHLILFPFVVFVAN